MEAERDVIELKKMQFMQQHIGEEFSGYITGVTGFGLFVELEELFVEGLVHISTLNDDLYTHIENKHSLVGRSTRRTLRIGDQARIKVASVSPATRKIEFILIGHTSSTPQAIDAIIKMEEYPRLPIKGKRLSGLGSGIAEKEMSYGKKENKFGKRNNSSKGSPKSGGKKRR
jgi:ribonuclease R